MRAAADRKAPQLGSDDDAGVRLEPVAVASRPTQHGLGQTDLGGPFDIDGTHPTITQPRVSGR